MDNKTKKIISKIEYLSGKYHKLSLLFYELAQSLKQEIRHKSPHEIKEYLKSYDFTSLEDMEINVLTDLKKKENNSATFQKSKSKGVKK